MKIKVLLAAGALILFKTISVPAAGGWTSGGGELIRDQHNPWFIQNTTQVNYCIEIDEKEFGQKKEFVSKQIEKAILFWKTNLKYLRFAPIDANQSLIVVGTQKFQEVSCDNAHELTFQFGILSEEQKRRMGDTSKIVGISIRTDYDLKLLRAKGFVYLPKDSQFSTHPWTSDSGMRILPVLIHEMGHVFGLQHNSDVQYMAEDYPASLIDTKGNMLPSTEMQYLNTADLTKTHIFKYIATSDSIFTGTCGENVPKPGMPHPIDSGMTIKKFFEAAEADNCFHYQIFGDTLKVYSGKDKFNLIGEAKLTELSPYFDRCITAPLSFWFSKEQKVFPALAEWSDSMKIPFGLYRTKTLFKGEYKSLNGKLKRKIALTVTNWGFIENMSGILDGELYTDVMAGI